MFAQDKHILAAHINNQKMRREKTNSKIKFFGRTEYYKKIKVTSYKWNYKTI